MAVVDVDHAVAVAELDDTLAATFMLTVGLNEPWRAQAACADKPLDIWFPEVTRGRHSRLTYADAKAVCHVCPVQTECALFAIRNNIPEGCYGGLDPADRKQIRQLVAGGAIQHGTERAYTRLRCRCAECCEGRSQRRALYQARQAAKVIVHGTVEGFIERFCGCAPCRKAWQADQARKRAEAAA